MKGGFYDHHSRGVCVVSPLFFIFIFAAKGAAENYFVDFNAYFLYFGIFY